MKTLVIQQRWPELPVRVDTDVLVPDVFCKCDHVEQWLAVLAQSVECRLASQQRELVRTEVAKYVQEISHRFRFDAALDLVRDARLVYTLDARQVALVGNVEEDLLKVLKVFSEPWLDRDAHRNTSCSISCAVRGFGSSTGASICWSRRKSCNPGRLFVSRSGISRIFGTLANRTSRISA